MKIVSLSVKSFGKLRDVNLTFNDGINVLSEVNGFGKTTMASFIRAMFYGFTYTRSKGATDASRYAPWGSDEKFGGSMVVEHNGETYRIERFFGKTARNEQLTVTKVSTSKIVNIQTSVGEYFLGLTADSYDRSAYFPQEAVELSSNDNLEHKLADLMQNNDVDYGKVAEKLRDFRRELRLERGSGGQIYDLTEKRNEYARRLSDAESAQRRAVEIDARLKDIRSEQEKLLSEQLKYKSAPDVIGEIWTRRAISEKDKKRLSEYNKLKAEINGFPSEIEQDKQMLDELANRVSDLKDDVKPRIYPNFPTLVISVILAIIGIVLCFVVPKPWNYVSGAALIILGIVGVIISFVKKGAMTLPAGERDALVSRYYGIASKYVSTQDVDYKGVVKRFCRFYNDYLSVRRKLETLRKSLKDILSQADGFAADVENLESRRELLTNRLAALANEEGRLVQERKTLNCDVVGLKENISRLDENIAQLEYRYKVALTVSQLLAEAKDNLSSNYLPRLCGLCQSLLCQVSNRKFEVTIDRAFNVQLRENGCTKPISDFSRGIREITLLCFRLALSELLYDGNIPFVIVDDAFVNFDEDNFVRATNLLRSVAERGQVIYFTCHKRLGNLLR